MNYPTQLIEELTSYQAIDAEESKMQAQLLAFVRDTPDCLYRTHLAGHLTASAFVVNHSLEKVLIIHHKKLDRWLQPGGHADGDPDLLAVAQKEVEEETGLLTQPLQTHFFDLDIHLIPQRKDVPEHFHYDLRYLLIERSGSVLKGNEEVKGLKWVKVSDLEQYFVDRSVLRMAEKCSPEFLKKVAKMPM